ncbi:MAG: hypothetical protein HY271_11610 [Deltaproteobacteria bacterium]|nr:hypothetical protein [Deltaproteobacteria bacterium]
MSARILLSMLLLVLAACARPPARDPAVVADVVAYVDKIKKWEPVEAEVLKAIHDVRRSQYVDDDYVISTLGAAMDDVELHLEDVERFRPRTAPVAQVHERYTKAWHDLHDSFTAIIAAMERKDYTALAHGTEEMQRARDELVTVAAALSLLMKDTGLKTEDEDLVPSEGAVPS